MRRLLFLMLLLLPSLFALASPRYALIVFYESRCPHCQRFDPVLKRYATSHHVPVLAYTLDNRSLPSFPNSVRPTPRELAHFYAGRPIVVPTLFLADMTHHKVYPVLQGEATFWQLSRRMSSLMQGAVS